MEIGYRSAGLADLDFRRKLRLARELNLSTIEVSLREFGTEAPSTVRALAQQTGIAMTAVGADLNLCVPTALDRALHTCEQGLKLCETLGVDPMCTRSLWPEADVPPARTWEHLVPTTRHLAQMCADAGVRLALEVDLGCFIDTLERAERLMQAVDHPNPYYNYDPTNFYLGGREQLAVLERHHARILNGHTKDGVYRHLRREETDLGEGEVPYREIFTRINQLGLDIAMNIGHCTTVRALGAATGSVHTLLHELGIQPP